MRNIFTEPVNRGAADFRLDDRDSTVGLRGVQKKGTPAKSHAMKGSLTAFPYMQALHIENLESKERSYIPRQLGEGPGRHGNGVPLLAASPGRGQIVCQWRCHEGVVLFLI